MCQAPAWEDGCSYFQVPAAQTKFSLVTLRGSRNCFSDCASLLNGHSLAFVIKTDQGPGRRFVQDSSPAMARNTHKAIEGSSKVVIGLRIRRAAADTDSEVAAGQALK